MSEHKRNNLGKINKKKKVNNNGASVNKNTGSKREYSTLSRVVREIKHD